MNAWIADSKTVVEEVFRRVMESPQAPAVRFLEREGQGDVWNREAFWQAAGSCAAHLESKGVKAGDVCALILPYSSDFVAWYWGIVRLGALPSVLTYPGPLQHPEKFRAGLVGVAQHSGLDAIITDAKFQPSLIRLLDETNIKNILTADPEVLLKQGWETERFHIPAPESAFLQQHSSGTTGLQKAIVLSHDAILKQLSSLSEALVLDPSKDTIVSWLPLYHDMGLIAAWLLPFCSGTHSVQLSPFDWVARPQRFMEMLSNYHGTLSWLPNFAFNLMADRVTDEQLEGLDLSHVRGLISCSEPVRGKSLDGFLNRFKKIGLKPQALGASYALAENVFAVTQTPLDAKPKTIHACSKSLSESSKVVHIENHKTQGVPFRTCVSSGKLIRGSELTVWDEQGHELPDGWVGELAIRSPYIFEGYQRGTCTDRPLTVDGWFATGDLGFVHEDEIYVVGRKKDLLIVRGKNIYPEDIEDCVGQVPGISAGRVCAFGEYNEAIGTETVTVLAESSGIEPLEQRKINRIIRSIVQTTMAIQVDQVILVPPRWLQKSSSGKMARKTNAERWKERREQGGFDRTDWCGEKRAKRGLVSCLEV